MEQDPNVKKAVETYRTGKLIGLFTGLVLCVAGLVLTILSFSGSIDWVLEVAGLTSRLVNASPGIVLTVAGVILLIVFNPKVKIKKDDIKRISELDFQLGPRRFKIK